MFVGENGVLYTIDGRNVHAIDRNGSVMWSVAIPDYYNMTIEGVAHNLSAVGEKNTWMGLDAKTSNGTLYMLVVPTSPTQFPRRSWPYRRMEYWSGSFRSRAAAMATLTGHTS